MVFKAGTKKESLYVILLERKIFRKLKKVLKWYFPEFNKDFIIRSKSNLTVRELVILGFDVDLLAVAGAQGDDDVGHLKQKRVLQDMECDTRARVVFFVLVLPVLDGLINIIKPLSPFLSSAVD